MAQPAYDVVGGLKYIGGPLQVLYFVTEEAVFKNCIVMMNASTHKARTWNGTSRVLGVALDHGAIGEKIAVSVDPEALYEATSYSVAGLADIGKFMPLTLENNSVRVGNYSTMRVVSGATATTPTLAYPVQLVGLANNVTNVAPASNHKCIVKLITGELEPFVDAV